MCRSTSHHLVDAHFVLVTCYNIQCMEQRLRTKNTSHVNQSVSNVYEKLIKTMAASTHCHLKRIV